MQLAHKKRMNSGITMADVATAIGVAPSTVSRALRGDARISSQRRQEIKEAAEAMGYRPNPMVSALMMNRNGGTAKVEVNTIALITDYVEAEGWRGKDVCQWEYEGLAKRAYALGYKLEEFALVDYGHDLSKLQRVLRNRGICGVIFGFSRNRMRKQILSTEHFAVAGLSAYFRYATVDRSNFHGLYNVRLALDKMTERGYRKIGLVVPEMNNRISGYLWSAGTLDWQRHLPRNRRCLPFIPDSDSSEGVFIKWMQKEKPDALLVYKLPVKLWLGRMGYRVPEDIGVAYLYRTRREMDSTAGIDGNLQLVGAAAIDLVVANLSTNQMGLPENPKEVLVKGFWCDGPTLKQDDS
ncbi:MAG: LacI family DNA-binding transcriptional regulator [Verrucomicrobiota bacterium]